MNEPQRRHCAVVLASLEEALLEIVQVASDTPDGRRLTLLVPDVPPGFLTRATPAIAALRGHLNELANTLRLDAQRQSKERTIAAILTAQIAQIQDSYARKLKGYGAVDPRLARRLDPFLASIEAALLDLRTALREGAPANLPAGEAIPPRS